MNKMVHHFFQTSDGENIFFSTNFSLTQKSERKLIVLNYGLVCSNYHWQEQLPFLQEHDFDILTYDYRGHFQSSGIHRIESITFEKMSEDLYELLQHINRDKCILLGHSMGVNLCLEFAHRYPKSVTKMILISGTIFPIHNVLMNTHLTTTIRPLLKTLLQKYPSVLKKFWKYGGWTTFVKKMIWIGGFNTKQVDMEFIDHYLNRLGQLGPKLFFQLITQMQHHDALGFVTEIDTETLVIGGNKDKVVPNYLQRLLHESLSHSEIYIIHEGSHVPQVDFPEMVNERILRFIN